MRVGRSVSRLAVLLQHVYNLSLQGKYGYPKLSRLEKLGINSQKLP